MHSRKERIMGTINAHIVRTRSEKHAPHCCPDDIFTPKRAWPPAPCRAYDLRYPDRRIEHREEEYCEPWCDYDAHDEGEHDEYEVPCPLVSQRVYSAGVGNGNVHMRLWSSYQASWMMNRTMEKKETFSGDGVVAFAS